MFFCAKQLNYESCYPNRKTYPLPKKNVLVLSCIDLRLKDDLVNFLNTHNLQNRYDHFILAGASLLCTEKHPVFKLGLDQKYKHWNECFEHHLEIAIQLHNIKDVYIVEHQDCGAYNHFLEKPDKDEKNDHKKFAEELAKRIHKVPREEKTVIKNDKGEDVIKKEKYQLNVHCFFIDLQGEVEQLSPPLIYKPKKGDDTVKYYNLGKEISVKRTS